MLPAISEYSELCLISSFDGLSSFGRKTAPEIQSFSALLASGFDLFFPFDEHHFLSVLKQNGKRYLALNNQEIAESIYTLAEDEELAVIDKALAENPELISLIHNPEAETVIIALGNYFEELVKLSSLLLTHHASYHFVAVARWSKLHNPELLQQVKKAKKLIFILDQLPQPAFLEQLAQLLEVSADTLQILSPKYDQLTSFQAEYQLEQTAFDAQHLFEQIIGS